MSNHTDLFGFKTNKDEKTNINGRLQEMHHDLEEAEEKIENIEMKLDEMANTLEMMQERILERFRKINLTLNRISVKVFPPREI